MKIYKDQNVLDAAYERLDIAFKEFDSIYFSVSGGKDSSVMVQLAAEVARKQGKTFSILYVDFESQYKATIDHMYDLVGMVADVMDKVYWVCLPISLRNAVSVIQPKWICWDKNECEKWVRPMPQEKFIITIDTMPEEWNEWFEKGQEFEDFILYFARYFQKKYGGNIGAGIGIRSDESLNRFRTITSQVKEKYKDYVWTTRVKLNTQNLKVYNFYPIYDWKAQDIWGCVSKLDLPYNEIYELMYKNGLTIHQQRLCQPYGDDQRNGLDQFRSLEPETWEKVLNRVHGANFGNIYCRTSLLGNLKSEKPDSISWQQYAVFLLESLGLYSPELRDHYHRKIIKFLKWWDEHGVPLEKIKDEDVRTLESKKKVPSWRRIARAIERNDFWMKRLTFSQTKSDVKLMYDLKKKYAELLDPEATTDKHLKQVARELNGV